MNSTTIFTHISDFHLPLSFPVRPWQLFSKRLLGYANLTLNRGKNHQREPFLKLFSQMIAHGQDHIVATGDLTNLALDNEFREIRKLFDQNNLDGHRLSVIPGNHDRYTPGAQFTRLFEHHMTPFLQFSTPQAYPTFRRIGNVALIGLCSARFRGPVRAAGAIDQKQLKRLSRLLATEARDYTKVVAVHHPPFPLTNHPVKQYLDGLQNYQALMEILSGRHVIVLHGHIHKSVHRTIGDIRVIGAPSASNVSRGTGRTMGYNRLVLDGNGLVEITQTTFDAQTGDFHTKPLKPEPVRL